MTVHIHILDAPADSPFRLSDGSVPREIGFVRDGCHAAPAPGRLMLVVSPVRKDTAHARYLDGRK